MPRESVLLRAPHRDPLKGKSRDEFFEALRIALTDRVLSAYVFGSLNTPRFNDDSDLDLILIKNTTAPFMTRAAEFDDLYDLASPLDVLVYTPDEFSSLMTNDYGFWRSVKETLVRVL